MIRELFTPEAHTSPYVWAAVLLAHFAIGAMLWLVVGWQAVVVYLAFEVLQAIVARRVLWWDSILDWTAAAQGALTMAATAEGRFLAAGCYAGACLLTAWIGYRKRVQ